MERLNFNELYKIRISNPDDSMRKHDVVKTMIVMEIMKRTKKEKKYHAIYTEYPVGKKGKTKKVDVYHKNLKTGETTIYEVQKIISKQWLKELKRKVPEEMNTQIIDLDKVSDDIWEMNEQVKECVIL